MTLGVSQGHTMINSLSGGLAKALCGAGRVAVDFLLPPYCMICAERVEAGGTLCARCWGRVDFVTQPLCPRTGRPFGHDPGPGVESVEALGGRLAYDRARVVARYEDAVRDIVHTLKYRDRLDLARPLGRLMARAGAELLADADCLVPVPLYRLRLWRRRYNQSALLARWAGRAASVPVRSDLLVRTRATRPQVGLTASQRQRNVSGAFAVPERLAGAVAGRRIVLVDDVITTGATIDACARCLRRAGAASVDVLAFARVIEPT